MNTLVDMFGNDAEDVSLGSVIGNSLKEIVDTRSAMIVDTSFISHDTSLHAQYIVGFGFLPSLHITLELELLRFKPVAWVVFITDSYRHDMQLLQSFGHRTIASHCHHLDNRLLSAVITILGTTLTLSNPNIVMLVVDDEIHVFSHSATVDEHFSYARTTLHDERLVNPHKILDPWSSKQIVANGNLAGGFESRVDEHHVEQCGVEHYVTMVAHEGVSARVVDSRDVDVASFTGLREKILEEWIAESYLKIEVGCALL